jgi:uncharacterized protein YjiS (DUF1127 family)
MRSNSLSSYQHQRRQTHDANAAHNHEDAVPKGQVDMTYFTDTASNATLIERLLATVSTALTAAAARQAKRRVYNTTLHELGALSNRDLADLGISRSEVRRIAWEAAYAQ